MSAQKRRADPVVIAELLREPQRFGFFQAVRLLERWLSAGAAGGQGLARVHFRNSLALSFAPSEIEQLSLHLKQRETHAEAGALLGSLTPGIAGGPIQECIGSDGAAGAGSMLDQVLQASPAVRFSASSTAPVSADVDRIEFTPAFMGMLGVAGTLPFHYTEQLAHRELYQKDAGPRAFMDIFQHRAVTLFYEAWRKHRMPMRFEFDHRQQYLPLVLALAGLGHKGLRDRMGGAAGGVADEALAFFSGALQQRTRSPLQLRQMLHAYLGVPVQVEQFVGRWYPLPEEQGLRLGGGLTGQGPAPLLGRTTSLGERVWQRNLRMRLVLGPLPHAKFLRFLPGGAGAHALKEMLTLYSGVSFEYEVNLRLRQADVQSCALDSRRPAAMGRLGWDTFLQTTPANDDRADVRYDIHAA